MRQLIDLRHETAEAISLQAIGAFMEFGLPAIVLFSGGKVWSVLLSLVLTAAIEQARLGRSPMVVIAHNHVVLENPEYQRRVGTEITKADRFAREHGVNAVVWVPTPAFRGTLPVQATGGRALASFPDSMSCWICNGDPDQVEQTWPPKSPKRSWTSAGAIEMSIYMYCHSASENATLLSG